LPFQLAEAPKGRAFPWQMATAILYHIFP